MLRHPAIVPTGRSPWALNDLRSQIPPLTTYHSPLPTPPLTTMKISLIGGGGLVGSCAASALQFGGIVSEIALVDVNRDLVDGQRLDLLHGAALTSDQVITAGGPELAKDADVICITAGSAPRSPWDQSVEPQVKTVAPASLV